MTFTCNNGSTYSGQSVYAVGSITELGSWDPANGLLLGSDSYPTWAGTIQLPANTDVEWKCVKREESNPTAGVQWQGGSNNAVNTASGVNTSGSF